MTEQIRTHGGTWDRETPQRSFYPYFFSPREELGILHRLQREDDRHFEAA